MSPRWVYIAERLHSRRWLVEQLELRTAPSDMLLMLGSLALSVRPGDEPPFRFAQETFSQAASGRPPPRISPTLSFTSRRNN
ncbi:MAG TPA: hypothetical protein VF306_06140 [Pirellulales bacterium]